MHEAGSIVSHTMRRVIDMVKPGLPQNLVAAEVYRSQVTGLEGMYGDYTSLCPLIQVGEGTSTPHLTWNDDPLPDNGLVVMEIAAARPWTRRAPAPPARR